MKLKDMYSGQKLYACSKDGMGVRSWRISILEVDKCRNWVIAKFNWNQAKKYTREQMESMELYE